MNVLLLIQYVCTVIFQMYLCEGFSHKRKTEDLDIKEKNTCRLFPVLDNTQKDINVNLNVIYYCRLIAELMFSSHFRQNMLCAVHYSNIWYTCLIVRRKYKIF